MKGKKLASFFLLVVVLEMLLLSASDATPFWRRRRSRRRYRRPPPQPQPQPRPQPQPQPRPQPRPCNSYKPFNSVNNWNQHFSFFCPNYKALNVWYSVHRNCKHDRIHRFQCKEPRYFPRRRSCAILSLANDYDKPLNFKCPHNGFITGVISEYSSYYKDRRFGFRCCHLLGGYVRHSCKQTHYLNNWDQPVYYMVPHGYSLAGVSSYHEDLYEDRRWKFEICKFTRRFPGWHRKLGK